MEFKFISSHDTNTEVILSDEYIEWWSSELTLIFALISEPVAEEGSIVFCFAARTCEELLLFVAPYCDAENQS